MNRIVKEHYPVSRLPDDVRAELGDATAVRLTIETVEDVESARPTMVQVLERVERLRAEGKIAVVTPEEAVRRIRALRDEWPA